jgi:cell division protein ZapA
MPAIKILNREYQIACGPGEEEKLISLATKLDKRLIENAKIFRGANENMLFILTALTMEDSLQDLKHQVEVLQKKVSQEIKLDNKDLDQIIDALVDRVDSMCKLISSK